MSDKLKNLNVDVTADTAPTWLNAVFFEKVLKQSENSAAIELMTLELKTASNKTEHYGSLMFRATIEYRLKNELKKQSMIIKTMFEQESTQKELFKESKIFNTEINIYAKVMPKFEAMLKAANDDTKIGPRVLYHALQPQPIIVFEDLATLGYTVLSDRATNYEETKVVYEKIAKWHALSYKMNLESPDFLKPFQHNIFETINLKDMPTFHDGINNFIDMLESQADLSHFKPYFEPYLGKMLSYWEKSAAEFLKDHQKTAYYALCHGDFHHKNMMFKRNSENGDLEDVLLIDFQLSYVGPMVNDIISSMFLIMNGEQRLRNLDELIYFYFETFKKTLKKIGFQGKIPKLLELRKQMTRHKGYEIFLLTTLLPLLITIDEGTSDIGQLMSDAENRKAMFKNPYYIEQVRQLLPKYLHMGYLEVDEEL